MELSAHSINSKAPYKVSQSTNLSFTFTTDNGNVYEVGFLLDEMLLPDGVYQFFIMENSGNPMTKDDKIMMTIVAIMEEFFLNRDVVLDYICDTSDSKQSLRFRLFRKWFANYHNNTIFTFRPLSIEYDSISYYGAVILRKDHPMYDQFMIELEAFEHELADKLR
ncbi:MAG: hypothetical protein IJR07_11405 [Bacteroidaceae bacterium]|nr:hypothetical protein [Bacteroidaceae bacterium]